MIFIADLIDQLIKVKKIFIISSIGVFLCITSCTDKSTRDDSAKILLMTAALNGIVIVQNHTFDSIVNVNILPSPNTYSVMSQNLLEGEIVSWGKREILVPVGTYDITVVSKSGFSWYLRNQSIGPAQSILFDCQMVSPGLMSINMGLRL